MPERVQVAVVGAGVAGLSAAWHLVELWRARGDDAVGLDLHVISTLVPSALPAPPAVDAPAAALRAASDRLYQAGSGVAGKAMSRSFVGYFDAESQIPRRPFYGPAMPWKGCIPHGYHILWQYPNLRRMLGDDGTGRDLDLRPPGGAAYLGAFQGLLDDPAPGGPGVACLGLCDPDDPDYRPRTDAARALFRLKDTPLVEPFLDAFRGLFGELVADVDPLVFADLFFAHEMDLEMRLALIGATLYAVRVDPERATVEVDGVERPLHEVEYDVWAKAFVRSIALGIEARGVPRGWREAVAEASDRVEPLRALVALAEGAMEAEPGVVARLVDLLPVRWRGHVDDLLLLWTETERVLRDVPAAAYRMASGAYPAWRSLHFRFAPDATFASPYSYDAAQAVRSLAFCYASPKAARMWSVDGQHIQGLWARFWDRLRAAAASTEGLVVLHEHEGRAEELLEDGEEVLIRWGRIDGHGGFPLAADRRDLGMPHAPDLAAFSAPAANPDVLRAAAAIPAMPPSLLRPLLAERSVWGAAHAQIDPIAERGNETLEILLWTRDRIEWSPMVRDALKVGAIGGLEGAFCMLAEYGCGLWTADTFEAERPFGPDDVPFAGSLLEACGGYADVFACATREDAYGWPAWIKEELARLLNAPAFFGARDDRPWPHDEAGWRRRWADGSWTAERAASREGLEDWFVACRWLAFGWIRQLSLIESVGPRACRQLADLADLLDPRRHTRAEILQPSAALLHNVRYVVMRNTKARNRFYNPAVGDWPRRPVSGLPLAGARRTFPAGDWTRNGLDVMCMEAACLSGMRAARGAWTKVRGEPVPAGAPEPVPVLPSTSWYGGLDPWSRI